MEIFSETHQQNNNSIHESQAISVWNCACENGLNFISFLTDTKLFSAEVCRDFISGFEWDFFLLIPSVDECWKAFHSNSSNQIQKKGSENEQMQIFLPQIQLSIRKGFFASHKFNRAEVKSWSTIKKRLTE